MRNLILLPVLATLVSCQLTKLDIIHWTPQDGAITYENMVEKIEAMGYECQLEIAKVGQEFPYHTHETDKLTGFTGCSALGLGSEGEEYPLKPGDIWTVPKGVPHAGRILPGEDCQIAECTPHPAMYAEDGKSDDDALFTGITDDNKI